MINKIFLGMFAAAAVIMSVLVFYAHRQLQSIGFKPETVAENFRNADAVSWNFLWFSAVALLVAANVVLWMTRRSWAMWVALFYFAAFTLAESWWLGALFSDYVRQNNLPAASSFGAYVFGAMLCILAAIIVFFDQFLVSRLLERSSPKTNPDTMPAAAEESPPVTDEPL